VFCPCKGIDHDFEKNIRSILEQDVSNHTPYFIVESTDDPAHGLLRQIGARHILVAGAATDCGQKVHNLRYAVQHVGSSADTYVFCDSDARYPRHWLRSLTSPLDDSHVGVTTGFRWYIPDRFHFATLLRSAWNATAVGLLGDHDRNFAWGGSMALRRETFERIDVVSAWRGAVSDDYAVTRAVQRAGLKVHFVPTCLIPSHGRCGFRELLEFTTRQIIITRVYHPRLWGIAFAAQTVFNVTLVWLMLRFFSDFTAAALWIAIFALSSIRSAIRLAAVRGVLDDPSLSRFAWFYILSSPAVAFLYQYNMIVSTLTSDIQWRQIHYKLISPNQTRVRRSSASAS
jgi:cellulose synthase/poly-beta-1,6-N-acetylglucosamine synthase-like glycosyltransferase